MEYITLYNECANLDHNDYEIETPPSLPPGLCKPSFNINLTLYILLHKPPTI